MIRLTPKNDNESYIEYEGGTDEEYMEYTSMLDSVKSRDFDAAVGKWHCGRIDAIRIHDKLNNPGVGDCMKLKPYGYQRQAIAFCIEHGYGLMRLSCGAGKTCIGLGAYLELRNRQLDKKLVGVFVVKVSLKNQWLDEVKKFTDLKAGEITTYKKATQNITNRIKNRKKKLEDFIASGPDDSLMDFMDQVKAKKQEIADMENEGKTAFDSMFDTEKYDIFVVNYEALTDDAVKEKLHEVHPEFWYVDEIDCIKSPTAKRTMAVCGFNDAKYRFGATATPIRKNPLDLYSIFHFIKPELFPKKSAFEQRYLKFYYGHISGSKNEEELAAKVEPYIFQRSMDEIADQLPEQLVYPVTCYFTERQEKMWQKIYSELEDLQEQSQALCERFTLQQLAQNAEYQRIKNAIAARQTFAQMQADSEELLMNSSELAQRYVTGDGSSKVAACLAILEKILASDQKCVIFSKYIGMQDILKREIKKDKELKGVIVDCITGSDSADARAKILKEYNENPEHQVLLISDAGESGLNLSSTRYMIEVDLADSAAKQTQRHGRIQRADSIHSKVFVYQLIVKDSYDDTIALRSIQKKAGYADRIL